MVGPGTVLTLGIVGAIAAVGVGLYVARDQIGGALSRGLTQSFTDPFRDYFGNLFRGSTGGGNGTGGDTEAQRQANLAALEQANEAARAAAQAQLEQQYGQQFKTYQDTLDVYKNLLEERQGPQPNAQPVGPVPSTFPGEEHRGANPNAPVSEPLFAPSPSGYYYFDFPGRKYDFQQKLGIGEADLYRKTDVGPASFKSLIFLGLSKISEAGISSFAQAKNLYL